MPGARTHRSTRAGGLTERCGVLRQDRRCRAGAVLLANGER